MCDLFPLQQIPLIFRVNCEATVMCLLMLIAVVRSALGRCRKARQRKRSCLSLVTAVTSTESEAEMKKLLVAFLIIFSALQCCDSKLLKRDKRDNVLALIKKSGYEGEAHRVTTEDGYFLKIHRVFPKTNRTIKSKPVFLMHGMLATSADFLVTGPDAALGFLLSDHGYDVWLGNARGNKHSMNHEKFSNSSKSFWTFSWHEIGYYDLPVMIDYMLEVTGSSKTFYAGHSQGTTSLLVLLSTRPEYNAKIVEAHLMAPSAFRKKIPRLRTLMIGLRFLVRFLHQLLGHQWFHGQLF